MKSIFTPVFLVSLFRTFLYSLIVTGTSACTMDAISPGWKVIIQLFIIQAGIMLAFLDQAIAKLSAQPPQLPLPPGK